MKKHYVLLALILLIAAAAWLASQFLHGGLSARATPTSAEIAVARRVRHLAIPAGARATLNPAPESPEVLRAGMMHFADHCALCHANDGSGGTSIGQGLFPKPPDLRLPRTQDLSDGEMFWIIENGVRFTGMPAFGTPGHAEQSWHLVRFIRRLPKLPMEELIEMQRNNPRSAAEFEEEREGEDFLREGAAAPQPESKHHHH
jgi:mono/diheme cytochrome c family protein